MTIPRPYRIFGATEQQIATREINKEVVEWISEWIAMIDVSPKIEVIPLSKVLDEGILWQMAGEHDLAIAAVGHGPAWQQNLLGLILGDVLEAQSYNQSDSIAKSLARQVMNSLLDRLYLKSGNVDAVKKSIWSGALPLDVDQPGAPYLAVRCTLCPGAELDILLFPELLDVWMKDQEHVVREPIQPVGQAFENEQLNLEIIIGEGELTIEEMGSLVTGDVIPLNRKLSQEISLQLDCNGSVCGGFLGSSHGKMAVQVAIKR